VSEAVPRATPQVGLTWAVLGFAGLDLAELSFGLVCATAWIDFD
jgi:hypothetical protein